MALKVVVGNLLARPGVGVAMTPAADALFPASYLYDGPGQLGARFGAIDDDPRVDIDLNDESDEGQLVDLGDGGPGPDETLIASSGVGDPGIYSWTGATSPEAGQAGALWMWDQEDKDGNGFSLFSESAYVNGVTWTHSPITVRRGVLYRMHAWVINFATAARVRLRDTHTGRYLGTDSAWHATPQDIAADSSAGAVFVGIDDLDFMVEGAEGTVELELTLIQEGAGSAYFDKVYLYVSPAATAPETDILAVQNGHNIPAGTAVEWLSSDDDFGTSTSRATGVAAEHGFYLEAAAPFQARYHRLVISGSPPTPYYMSDLVLGLATSFAREPVDGISISYPEVGQIRQQGPAGTRRIQNRGPYPPRTLSVNFRFPDAAEEAAFRAVFVDELRGGAESILILPASDLEPMAIYGDIEQPLNFRHSMAGALQPGDEKREYYSDVDLVVMEGAGFEMSAGD